MRPEGFNPRKISDVILKDWNAQRMVEEGEHIAPLLVEAGADAMLEGLKKKGYPISGNTVFTYDAEGTAGYLVFISEE